MKKYAIAFLGVFLALILFLPQSVYAEENGIGKGFIKNIEGWKIGIKTVEEIVGEPGENVPQMVGKLKYGVAEALVLDIIPEALENGDKISDLNARKGLTGFIDNAVITLFHSQPSTDVIAHLANEWVPGYQSSNSVYASGYDDLMASGVNVLWSKVRNISYTLYIVIMLIIGFMIMFRNKINGQIMVTVGNSLPKIIISLILVTFSFAIMGIIINVGGIITGLVSGIYFGAESSEVGVAIHDPVILLNEFFGKGIWEPLSGVIEGVEWAGLNVAGIVHGFSGMFPALEGPGTFISLLLTITIAVCVLWGAIRLFMTLVKAYLGLIINVIISPLSIMIGALPGKQSAMLNVFFSALRNVLVFPLAYAIVNLPYYLESQNVTLGFPDSLTNSQTQTLGDGFTGFLLSIAKIIAVFAAASAPAILQSVIPSGITIQSRKTSTKLQTGLSKIPFIGTMLNRK